MSQRHTRTCASPADGLARRLEQRKHKDYVVDVFPIYDVVLAR